MGQNGNPKFGEVLKLITIIISVNNFFNLYHVGNKMPDCK